MSEPHVRIMLSHDYCHFEIELPVKEGHDSPQEVNELRKTVQRLADQAVLEFRKKQDDVAKRDECKNGIEQLNFRLWDIMRKPKGDRSERELEQIEIIREQIIEREAVLNKAAYDYDEDDLPF